MAEFAFTMRKLSGRFPSPQNRRDDMRHMVLGLLVAAGVGLLGMAGASAAPANGKAISQLADHSSQIIHVRGGCGRGWHRGPHGHCRPN
jgi:hypothetical protein